jgi:hypothetical protein
MKLSVVLTLLGLLSSAAALPIAPAKRALPRLGGLNIAGCDFGMNVWGWSGTSMCPGTEQIGHFIEQGSNVIRLPVGWQYLVGNDAASTALDPAFFATYDRLVTEVTRRGAYAIIDLHNYGRWNSGVVGADGPSNDAFARLWALLAKKYANNDKVMFGLMNEPHDQDIGAFAVACQAAVNAIRAAGATSQAIILPGGHWTKAAPWTCGNNPALGRVTDPAGGVDRLLLDIHKYLDADGSGTAHECVIDGLDVLAPFAQWARANGRRGIITEMGGATTDSCQTFLPKMLKYVVDNDDVFVGFTAWAAGSFQPYPGYELSLTPNADGSDNALWTKAIRPFLPGSSGVVPSSAAPSSTPASSVPASSVPASSVPASSVPASSVPASSVPASSKPVTSASPTSSAVTSASASPSLPPVLIVSSVPAPSTSASQEPSSSAAPSASSPASSAAASSSAEPKPSSAVQSSVQSSAAQSASSSAPQPPSSSAPPSSAAPVQSSAPNSSPTSSTTAPTPTPSDNFQTFTDALGGIPAPAVTRSGAKYYTNGQEFNFLVEALNRSCYTQMDRCQLAANINGNAPPLTVENCNGTQIKACLTTASAIAGF